MKTALCALAWYSLTISAWSNPRYHICRIEVATGKVLERNQGQEATLSLVGAPGPGEQVLAVPWVDMQGNAAFPAHAEAASLQVPRLKVVGGALQARPTADIDLDVKTRKIATKAQEHIETRKQLDAANAILVEDPQNSDVQAEKDKITARITKIKADLATLKQ